MNDVADALDRGSMIATYKEALRLMGYDLGFVRPPHRELSAVEKKTLAKKLKAVGVI
jgi:dihydrodipicolinate synthase/N-acetylneuraminate lyase